MTGIDSITGDNFLIILGKILLIVILIAYFFVAVLISRQVWLMNKSIKTRLAGLLNCIALLHLAAIVVILILAVFV